MSSQKYQSALCFHRCDSIEKLKAQLPKMEQELKDQGKFKDFYQFTFNFAKNPGQKGLGKGHLMLIVSSVWLFVECISTYVCFFLQI